MNEQVIKLIKNADVFAPEHLGKRDILICDEKICAVEERLEVSVDGGPAVEVIDVQGAAVGPGYLDGHVHITGGGGEQGPGSRVPECRSSEIVSCGVTTVLALLGTDCISRSLENVLAKARALTEEGISAYMLTGSYRIPSPTLTGSVMRDLVLIDKVIGAKVALSDHRSSAPTVEELARLVAQALEQGVDIRQITVSSDGYGSQPVFNEKMECTGMTYSRCSTVHDELCRMVQAERIPLETALRTVTSNVADRMGLAGRKGAVRPGADADLVVWNSQMQIERVFARGRLAFHQGKALLRGRFETAC